MTGTRPYTSVYADTWRALHRLLSNVPWPAPPVSAPPMRVFLGSFDKDNEPLEGVLLVMSTIKAPRESQDWALIGRRGRNETFATDIEVGTFLRGRKADEALDRLEELTAAIEQLIVVTTDPTQHPEELAGRMAWWEVANVDPVVGPLVDGGFGGWATITIAVNARIGGIS